MNKLYIDESKIEYSDNSGNKYVVEEKIWEMFNIFCVQKALSYFDQFYWGDYEFIDYLYDFNASVCNYTEKQESILSVNAYKLLFDSIEAALLSDSEVPITIDDNNCFMYKKELFLNDLAEFFEQFWNEHEWFDDRNKDIVINFNLRNKSFEEKIVEYLLEKGFKIVDVKSDKYGVNKVFYGDIEVELFDSVGGVIINEYDVDDEIIFHIEMKNGKMIPVNICYPIFKIGDEIKIEICVSDVIIFKHIKSGLVIKKEIGGL